MKIEIYVSRSLKKEFMYYSGSIQYYSFYILIL